MFGIADYASFVIAVIVFLMIPGPGNLALITSTGKGGLRGGLAATLGVIAGDQVLMWLAVAGVAALLAAYPPAFHGVQWLGAGYLAWLGLRMLLAKPGDAPVLDDPRRPLLPPGARDHLAQPQGDRLLHGVLSALRRSGAAGRHRDVRGHGGDDRGPDVPLWRRSSRCSRIGSPSACAPDPRIGRLFGRAAGAFIIGFGVKLALSR